MKKFVAAFLSIALLALLCVSVSARELDYKAYPLFDSEGKMTDGVEFYVCGDEIDYDWVVSRINKGYPDNCIGATEDANLPAKIIIWSLNVGHMPFGTGIRICGEDAVVKITFTGRGFRLISDYAEGSFSAPVITVDGEDIEVSLDEVDVASETIIAEKEGLEWGVHTVVITGTGDCEFDSFEIAGVPGVYEGPEITEEDTTEPETQEPETQDTDKPEPQTQKPASSTASPTVTDKPATEPASSDTAPVNIGLIIGVVAAIIVVAAIVTIIVKKKK